MQSLKSDSIPPKNAVRRTSTHFLASQRPVADLTDFCNHQWSEDVGEKKTPDEAAARWKIALGWAGWKAYLWVLQVEDTFVNHRYFGGGKSSVRSFIES